MRLRPQACFEANRRKAALRPRWHIESAPASFGYFPSVESNEGTVPPSRTTVRSLEHLTDTNFTDRRTGCCGPDHACLLTDQKAPKVAGGPLRKGGKPPDPCPPKRPDYAVSLADTTGTVVMMKHGANLMVLITRKSSQGGMKPCPFLKKSRPV